MKYEEMLKRVFEQVGTRVEGRKRFEIPKLSSFIEGNRTIITNLFAIASYLNRDPSHLTRFLLKELATFGSLDVSKRLVLTGKFSDQIVNERVRKYCELYVICKECGHADTKLIREGRITFMKCLACGARRTVE